MSKRLSYADNSYVKVTGADQKNPARFRQTRGAISSPALGEPPAQFDKHQKAAFRQFKVELPWLCEADRCIVELAATLRAKIEQNTANQFVLGQYRSILVQLGATPASRGRVKHAPQDDEDDDGDGERHTYS